MTDDFKTSRSLFAYFCHQLKDLSQVQCTKPRHKQKHTYLNCAPESHKYSSSLDITRSVSSAGLRNNTKNQKVIYIPIHYTQRVDWMLPSVGFVMYHKTDVKITMVRTSETHSAITSCATSELITF